MPFFSRFIPLLLLLHAFLFGLDTSIAFGTNTDPSSDLGFVNPPSHSCQGSQQAARHNQGSSKSRANVNTCTASAVMPAGNSADPVMAGCGLPISRIGYGTYRIGLNNAEQAESLREALLHGINVIDTSANYGNGEAEECIGQVVRELMQEGKLKREDILLVSKVGYIQGQNMDRYLAGTVRTPDTVEVASYLGHCIHPAFIQDQLGRSLARLGMPSLDVFLLHNPEYYLTHNVPAQAGAISAEDLQTHRDEMDRRLLEAFKALEGEIASGQGRIRSYGISSNSFSLPPEHPHFLRYDHLAAMAMEAAKAVSPEAQVHHFSTIQLPANLLEQEGLHRAVQWAARTSLTVLINRPLNAFDDRMSLRLAEYPDSRPAYHHARDALLQYIDAQKTALSGHEKDGYTLFQEEVGGIDAALAQKDLHSVLAWEGISSRMVMPMLRRGLEATARPDKTFDAEGMRLAQEYLRACERLVSYLSGIHAREEIEKTLGFGPIPAEKSLQEFAIEFLLEHAGVSTVLLGCRNTRYVRDAIKINDKHPSVHRFLPR